MRPWRPLALLALAAACGPAELPPADGAAVVDTVLDPAVALERFRSGFPEVTALEGGRDSREELVQAFVAAVATRDTTTLAAMHLTPAEFAWLYYPTSLQATEPTYLPPDLAWFTLSGRTSTDLPTLLERVAGHELAYVSHDCPTVRDEGPNRVHGHCTTRLRVDGTEEAQALFGLIVERDGRFKFVNYANRME